MLTVAEMYLKTKLLAKTKLRSLQNFSCISRLSTRMRARMGVKGLRSGVHAVLTSICVKTGAIILIETEKSELKFLNKSIS